MYIYIYLYIYDSSVWTANSSNSSSSCSTGSSSSSSSSRHAILSGTLGFSLHRREGFGMSKCFRIAFLVFRLFLFAFSLVFAFLETARRLLLEMENPDLGISGSPADEFSNAIFLFFLFFIIFIFLLIFGDSHKKTVIF